MDHSEAGILGLYIRKLCNRHLSSNPVGNIPHETLSVCTWAPVLTPLHDVSDPKV